MVRTNFRRPPRQDGQRGMPPFGALRGTSRGGFSSRLVNPQRPLGRFPGPITERPLVVVAPAVETGLAERARVTKSNRYCFHRRESDRNWARFAWGKCINMEALSGRFCPEMPTIPPAIKVLCDGDGTGAAKTGFNGSEAKPADHRSGPQRVVTGRHIAPPELAVTILTPTVCLTVRCESARVTPTPTDRVELYRCLDASRPP
jgi:hypothetical protein